MPRRNVALLLIAAAISILCYQRVEHNRYGRYLSHALEAIERTALEEVPAQELFNGAMEGIVAQLNRTYDQNSSFISAQQRQQFEAELNQEFGGIGVMIQFEYDENEEKRLIVVYPPLMNTPAGRAGIRARDEIVAIDGEEVAEMTLTDVVATMRGEPGEPLELTLRREGEPDEITITLRRAIIDLPSVKGYRRIDGDQWQYLVDEDPRIAYIRIESFGEKTYEEFARAMEQVAARDARALILDLRDNAGGLLDAAVEISELFLQPDQAIVSIRGRLERNSEEYRSRGRGPLADLPLAVLVNEFTASASEIVAACLQDHHRAVVIGTRTFGKGTVQHVIPVEAGRSMLKITAASYWRPSNRNIHKSHDADEDGDWGVLPNDGCLVKMSLEQEKEARLARARRYGLAIEDDVNQVPDEQDDTRGEPQPEGQAPHPQSHSDPSDKNKVNDQPPGKKDDQTSPSIDGQPPEPRENREAESPPVVPGGDLQLDKAIEVLQQGLDGKNQPQAA